MPWLIEFDIKGLFDNIDHELMMKAVRKHTENKWIILYIERFLNAPIVMPNGIVQERTSGTPQGGVISPVRDRIRDIRTRNKSVSIEELAKLVNPVIRGWFNYFSKYAAGSAKRILTYVNLTIARWTKSKYKSMKGSTLKAMRFLKRIAKCNPNLFYHWQIGLLPAIG
jgi:retron-type reverse transcriptase